MGAHNSKACSLSTGRKVKSKAALVVAILPIPRSAGQRKVTRVACGEPAAQVERALAVGAVVIARQALVTLNNDQPAHHRDVVDAVPKHAAVRSARRNLVPAKVRLLRRPTPRGAINRADYSDFTPAAPAWDWISTDRMNSFQDVGGPSYSRTNQSL